MSSEESYEESIRRLAEIETEIDELTKIERLIQRMNEHEKSLKNISNALDALVKKDEFSEAVKSTEKGMNDYLDGRLKVYDEIQKENVKRLSHIDAEIIDKLRRVERFLDRTKELEMEVKKIKDLCEGLVGKDELEIAKIALEERIEKAKVPQEEIKELAQEIQSLRGLIDVLARRSDLVDLRKEIKGDELEEMKKYFEKRIEANEHNLEEHVKGLAQIDSEIINKIRRMEHFFDKLNEQILTLRKLSYEEKSRYGREEEKLLEEKKLVGVKKVVSPFKSTT